MISLIRNSVKVEFENIGEGRCGDYDPDDPDDVNLLRFSVYYLCDEIAWVPVDDASYCTQLPANTSREILEQATRRIMDEVEDAVRSGDSVKKMCEELSWMSPDWFKEEEDD